MVWFSIYLDLVWLGVVLIFGYKYGGFRMRYGDKMLF